MATRDPHKTGSTPPTGSLPCYTTGGSYQGGSYLVPSATSACCVRRAASGPGPPDPRVHSPVVCVLPGGVFRTYPVSRTAGLFKRIHQ